MKPMNGNRQTWLAAFIALFHFGSTIVLPAEVMTTAERISNDQATGRFRFKNVPAPVGGDAATRATVTIVDGQRDTNGGDIGRLNDGKLPIEDDQPAENFFFEAGTDGGRILVDLGAPVEVRQVASYSWHTGSRGPQVYTLFASDGKAANFDARPKRGTAPRDCGWQLIANVDTRPKEGEPGGQYGVAHSNPDGALGSFRYLLFDISPTADRDRFGNTFFSEIDVIDKNAPPSPAAAPPDPGEGRKTFEAGDGKFRILIDTTDTPDLTEWARSKLAPVLQDWYPKIVAALPSDGFEAPAELSVTFSADMRGVAATGGTRIRCAASWFRRNLEGEAVGAVVHELVHVVQQYGRARRANPNAPRPPGWLVEGIPDYIRWFQFEPQSRGAEISRLSLPRARYDGSYRISANFLNWVSEKHDKEIARKLNAALRHGTYTEDIWKELTGKTVGELGDEWKKALEEKTP